MPPDGQDGGTWAIALEVNSKVDSYTRGLGAPTEISDEASCGRYSAFEEEKIKGGLIAERGVVNDPFGREVMV